MKDKIMAILAEAIKDLNEELQYESLKNIDANTGIFGDDDGIDSLSLAFLISQVEIKIDEELGQQVILADEKAMSMQNSPYRTVGSLVDFIVKRLEETHV